MSGAGEHSAVDDFKEQCLSETEANSGAILEALKSAVCPADGEGDANNEGEPAPALAPAAGVCASGEGQGSEDMAAVAAFAGTPTFDRHGRVTATTGGAGALSVCLAASAAAAVGTPPPPPSWAPDSVISPTVGVGGPDSTAAISLSIDCAATSELCRVRRPAPRTQPF